MCVCVCVCVCLSLLRFDGRLTVLYVKKIVFVLFCFSFCSLFLIGFQLSATYGAFPGNSGFPMIKDYPSQAKLLACLEHDSQ